MEKLFTEVERIGPLLSLANLAVGYSSTWFTGMIRLVCRPTVGGSSGIGAKGSTGTGGLSMAFAPDEALAPNEAAGGSGGEYISSPGRNGSSKLRRLVFLCIPS